MLWRLAVAAAALLGFLSGATILAAQFERDMAIAKLDNPLDLLGSIAPPEDTKPFRFDDLTLPQDLPITLPPGATINPDGSISLPDGSDLKLPLDGASFKDVKIDIDRLSGLSIPDGTNFDGKSLLFDEEGKITIPGAGDFKLPAGTKLDLPPDLARELAEKGYSGSLPAMDVPLNAGTQLNIPELKAPTGGTLPTNSQTRLTPPAGQSFGLPPGTVQNPTGLTLPAGTDVSQLGPLGLLAGIAYVASGGDVSNLPTDIPTNPNAGAGGGGNTTQPGPGNSTGNSTVTPVVAVNAEGPVEKGQPFNVVGFVRSPGGQGIPGVAVDVYLNGTGPGLRLGSAITDAVGTFRATYTLPETLEPGEYRLVANSQPKTVGAVRYLGAWGE